MKQVAYRWKNTEDEKTNSRPRLAFLVIALSLTICPSLTIAAGPMSALEDLNHPTKEEEGESLLLLPPQQLVLVPYPPAIFMFLPLLIAASVVEMT
jgi:hypothetical protein